MLRKLFRTFLILFQTAIACVIVAVLGFLWRLHQAPINIDKYVPYLIQMTSSSDAPVNISIGRTELRWGSWSHLVDFHLSDYKAYDENNHLIASVPQLSFSFSLSALLHGTISTKTLVVYRPYLDLTLDEKGDITQKMEEDNSSVSLTSLIEILRCEKYLTELSLIKAAVKITNATTKKVWNAPEVNLTYTRRFRKSKLNGFIKIDLDGKNYQSVKINGSWKKRKIEKNKEISFTVQTENLQLTKLIPVQKYPFFKNITTPIDLTIETKLSPLPLKEETLSYLRHAVSQINFTVTGKKGMIELPDPVMASYDLRQFTISGDINKSANGFDLSKIELVMQNGATAQGTMSVSGIGHIIDTGSWEKLSAELSAKAQNIPVEKLASYWPASLGPDVHGWVKQNITGGMIDSADFALHFKGLPDEIGITPDMVDGIINVAGTKITYLDGMPAVDDVSGQLHLTLDDLVITINKTSSHNVTAEKGGTFSILGMTKPVTTAALNIDVNGNVPDILAILDSPALGFMSLIGINPQKTTGTAQGNLQLKFPLGSALQSAEQIYVKTDAEVHNADVEDIILGLGVQDAILKVKMDGKSLSLAGTSLFYGAATNYSLKQSFDNKKEVMTDIKLHVDLNDKAREHLNYPYFTAPAITGVMPTDLELIFKRNGTGILNISSDLSKTEIDIREIGWTKPFKIDGKAVFTLNLKDGKPTNAPVISLTDSQGNVINGSLSFTDEGRLKQVKVPVIKTKYTDAALDIDFDKNEGIFVSLTGEQLDISGVLKKGLSYDFPQSDEEKTTSEKAQDENTSLQLAVNAFVDKIRLSEKGASERNKFELYYYGDWEKILFDCFVGDKTTPLTFSMKPTKEDKIYSLALTTTNFGEVLNILDYTSTVNGGKLTMSGSYVAGIGANGSITVSDFYLGKDKILTRILQLTSLTGILDTLRGEGLHFDSGDIPFIFDETGISVDSALIAGSSLGITMNGKFFRKTKYLNVYGSVIPFYSINSFLGKLPVVGTIFSGEKGGGLIAPTYTIKGNVPSVDISVNALSALAPGTLRSMLGKLFRNDGDLSQKEEKDSKEKEPVKETFKPIDPSLQNELSDDDLEHDPTIGQVLP